VATFNEYSARYDRIRNLSFSLSNQITLLNSEVSRGAVSGPPDNIDSRADAINRQIDASIDQLNALSEEIASSDLTLSQQESLQNVIDVTGNALLDMQQRLNGIESQANQNQQRRNQLEQTQAKNSAPEIVKNEQDANAEGAEVQSPGQGNLIQDKNGRVRTAPENTNTSTNARVAETDDDDQSNVTTSTVGGDGVVGGGDTAKTAGNTTFDDATDPDLVRSSTASTTSSTKPTVAKEFLQPIVAKPNLLSGLSSMTYSLSMYLMSPDEFAAFVEAEEKIVPTRQLLIQSGGASKSERNEWFNVDFYIENLKLESVVGTQGVGSPHNAVSLEFEVVEPQGITFLNRLNNAVISHLGEEATASNAMAQGYLMVIRFYGYDASGNPVTASDLGLPQTTDTEAVVEKFIPFNITNFTYKIGAKLTQYNIKGACTGTNTAFSTQRGEVPFNMQLTAGTVDQLFNGNVVLAESQADESNAPKQNNTTGTVVYGLTQALNKHQRKLVSNGSIEIADEYEIVFQDSDIKNAELLKPGNANKGTASNQTNQQAAQKFLNSKLNYNKKDRSWSVPAGTQIAQLLDLVIRTSSYITSQQNFIFDEKTGKYKAQQSKVPTVQWYRVKSQVKPIGYDKKRKTLAYKITYFVNKYQINTPRSPHFPAAQYRGVHKLYNWIFTGQNTEVLDFEIDVNSNYYAVIGNDGLRDDTPNGSIPVQQSYSSAPGQSLQGGERNSTFPAANLSDRLYNEGDVARSEIEIVGDPDWIQQSEIVYNKSVGLSPFLPDGGVNYDSQEVLFEIRFNPGQDYDLSTGLSNVYENNRTIHANGQVLDTNVAQESLVFNAITVTSMFSDGSFTQRLVGTYRDFAGAKDASPDDQVKPAKTTEQQLSNTDLNANDTGPVQRRSTGLREGVSASDVRTNKGVVVEFVDSVPGGNDDDAGFRIDSRGNRVNFNLNR